MESFIIAVPSLSAFTGGVMLGVGSVLSVGPNNLMLLREGVSRGRTGTVIGTVLISYALLLTTACFFADWLAMFDATMRTKLAGLGLAALSSFAFLSLRAGLASKAPALVGSRCRETHLACLRRALRVIWLNPLTYLELLLIPAALCEPYETLPMRVEFVTGLMTMAAIASCAYSFAGGLVASLVGRRNVARLFDLVSGLILAGVALVLASELVS